MGKIIKYLKIIAVLFILFATGYFVISVLPIFKGSSSSLLPFLAILIVAVIAIFLLLRPSQVKQFKATIIIEKIREVAKLMTQEIFLSCVVEWKEVEGGLKSKIFGHKQALILGKGKASVGIKVDELKIEIKELVKKIVITTPNPNLLSLEIPPEGFNTYHESAGSFLRKISKEERDTFYPSVYEFLKTGAEEEITKEEFLVRFRSQLGNLFKMLIKPSYPDYTLEIIHLEPLASKISIDKVVTNVKEIVRNDGTKIQVMRVW